EIALHELLSECRASLLNLAGAQVHEGRTHDRAQIDAVMRIELAVFDDLQGGRQQAWHFIRPNDDSVLAVDRKNAADQKRIEPENGHVLAAPVAHALDAARRGGDRELLRLLQRIPKAEEIGRASWRGRGGGWAGGVSRQ